MVQQTDRPRITRRRGTPVRAGDATGRKAVELEEQAALERERDAEMTMITAQREAQIRDEVVDLSGKGTPAPDVIVVDEEDDDGVVLSDEELLERVQSGEADQSTLMKFVRRFKTYKTTAEQDVIDAGITVFDDDTATVRVSEDIENMTFGAGNHLSLKAGQRYRVSAALAKHLEEKGLIWH